MKLDKKLFFLMSIGLWLMLVGCTSTTPEPTVTPEPIEVESVDKEVITLGVISNDPIEEIEELQPLADYLAASLTDTDVDIKIVLTLQDMVDAMSNGEIDIFFESVYGAAIVMEASNSQLALRRWKGGVEEYHTVIFANTDSQLTDISDIGGNIIAFEASESTSSFVLPSIYLRDAGFNLAEVASVSSDVDDETVGYMFSDDDDNTIQWVITGRVPLGAVNNHNYEEDISDEDREQLIILAETETIPRHVVVYSGTLSGEQHTAISEALSAAHETDGGAEALQIFGKTSKFDAFPEGVEAASSSMLSMVETMNDVQG